MANHNKKRIVQVVFILKLPIGKNISTIKVIAYFLYMPRLPDGGRVFLYKGRMGIYGIYYFISISSFLQ